MARSEGAERKGRKAALFRARDGGKPCVAQPPQRDMRVINVFQAPRLLPRGFFMGWGLWAKPTRGAGPGTAAIPGPIMVSSGTGGMGRIPARLKHITGEGRPGAGENSGTMQLALYKLNIFVENICLFLGQSIAFCRMLVYNGREQFS